MMKSNIAFRSHLMQQFAAVARSQSRPPIALTRASFARNEPFLRAQSESTLPTNQAFDQRTLAPLPAKSAHEANADFNHLEGSGALSVEPGMTVVESQEFEDPHDSINNTGASFQTSISTHRNVQTLGILDEDLRSLLDRIILDAQFGPRYGRLSTKNCSFKRLVSKSAINAVSEIGYHVTMHRRLVFDPKGAHVFAERKKKRWSQIPAYLVVLVRNQPEQVAENAEVYQYLELPYVPPATALQLADCGAAYSAVNNILSSLHAWKIGTNMVTDHVLQTSAFRELIGATSTDRVVAMIMVGYPGSGHSSQERSLGNGITALQDL